VIAGTPWNRIGFYGVLDLDARGGVVLPQDLIGASVWVPTGNWAGGLNTEDCQGWVGGPGFNGSVERFDRSVGTTSRPCSEAHRLYCLEVP
jgi:hypothetical protein